MLSSLNNIKPLQTKSFSLGKKENHYPLVQSMTQVIRHWFRLSSRTFPTGSDYYPCPPHWFRLSLRTSALVQAIIHVLPNWFRPSPTEDTLPIALSMPTILKLVVPTSSFIHTDSIIKPDILHQSATPTSLSHIHSIT